MKTTLRVLGLCAAVALSASAQSLNIDLGSITPGAPGGGTPAPVYGAAARQPGMWNYIATITTGPFAMFDLAGAPTSVTCTRDDGIGGLFAFNNTMTTGYFQSLMDDGHSGGGVGTYRTYTFSGLTPGRYVVFTYAWAPDSTTDRTSVDVVGTTSPTPQIVGGALTAVNTFTTGITHAVHAVTVGANGILTINWTAAVGYSTINGFQICKDYRLTMTQTSTGGAVTIANNAGQPGNAYANLFTFTAGSFPNGPLFGLDLSISDALSEVSLGVPFFGFLNADGQATFTVPAPMPSGLTVYAVGVELDAALATVVSVTAPFSFTSL